MANLTRNSKYLGYVKPWADDSDCKDDLGRIHELLQDVPEELIEDVLAEFEDTEVEPSDVLAILQHIIEGENVDEEGDGEAESKVEAGLIETLRQWCKRSLSEEGLVTANRLLDRLEQALQKNPGQEVQVAEMINDGLKKAKAEDDVFNVLSKAVQLVQPTPVSPQGPTRPTARPVPPPTAGTTSTAQIPARPSTAQVGVQVKAAPRIQSGFFTKPVPFLDRWVKVPAWVGLLAVGSLILLIMVVTIGPMLSAVVAQPTKTKPTPTQKPAKTPTPIPAVSALALNCENGYMGFQVFLKPDYKGRNGWKTLDFTKDPSGPVLGIDHTYWVTTIKDRSDVVLIQTENGAYFIPSDWVAKTGEDKCVGVNEVKAFSQAFDRLNPVSGFFTSLSDGGWWSYPVGAGLFIVFALVGAEFIRRKAIIGLTLYIATVPLTLWMMKGVDEDHKIGLFVWGLLASVALGLWENRGELLSMVNQGSTSQNISPKVLELLKDKRFIGATNWSYAAVWFVANIAFELLLDGGSPLRVMGPIWSVVVLGIGMNIFYALDALRRKDSLAGPFISFGGFVMAMLVTSVMRQGPWQYVGLMGSWILPVVPVIVIGAGSNDMIKSDRIIDLLGGITANVIWGIVLAIRLGWAFNLIG